MNRRGSKCLAACWPVVRFYFGAAAFLVFVGCGDSSTAPVIGKVTYKGQPVTSGTIMFYPAGGRATAGAISEDGSYELSESALVGSHAVTIESREVTNTSDRPKSLEDELRGAGVIRPGQNRVVWQVPQRYADKNQSGLTAEVHSGETNIIDFDL
jgi:hypothetical protein